MNLSRNANSCNFKDYSNGIFKIHLDDGIPLKFSDSFRYCHDNTKVRIIKDWILSVNQISMNLWKYNNPQKCSMSNCKEYFLPNSDLKYSSNQGTILYDETYKPSSCIIVGDDAVVRFWPDMSSTKEYIDQKIPNINNDSCVLVEQISNDVLVILFSSMKIIVADLKDFIEVGITFKQFSPHTGFMSGISRCFSYFVSSNNQNSPFINMRQSTTDDEDIELLMLVDNNIDSFRLDVLHNGKYNKAIISHNSIQRAIIDKFPSKYSKDSDQLIMQLKYFDLKNVICYVFVEIMQSDNQSKDYFMVTYNRKLEIFDSVAEIDCQLDGDVEIMCIEDAMQNEGHPCLLVGVKDNHKILIIEVLTGVVKAELDASSCLKSRYSVNPKQSIIGWNCPKLIYSRNVIVAAMTTEKKLIFIKQHINSYMNESFESLVHLESRPSNQSISEMVTTNKDIGYHGDFEMFNNSFSSRFPPIALSTPKSKLDQKGDTRNALIKTSLLESREQINISQTLDDYACENSKFGEFKKCVILFWLGFKTQANRSMINLIDTSRVDSEVSIPFFIMKIVREIIDEHPRQDPRWMKLKNQSAKNEFCYSNDSLILFQQLSSKCDALEKLLLMLKENNFNCFGKTGNIAPISVGKCLFVPGGQLEIQLFGEMDVSWSLANCIGLGGELVEFVRVFNEIMNNTTSPEVTKIMSKTCSHILSVQKKLSAMDIFSQQISLVPSFIHNCSDCLSEMRVGLSDLTSFDLNVSEQFANIKRFCQLLSRILSNCLRASLEFRRNFESSFLARHFDCSYLCSSTSAPCWITENSPIGVSESIMDLVMNLIDFSRNFENDQIYESIFDIVSVYLDCFRHRIEWMENFSMNQMELQRLFQSFYESRYQLIGKLVEDGKFIERSLELADQYMDFHWIISLCEVLDGQTIYKKQLHLDKYLHKFHDDGFSEYVLNWYQEKLQEGSHPNYGRLLAKIQLILEKIQKLEVTTTSVRLDNSSSSAVIGKFLDRAEIQPTRWLHEIETENFQQAAKTLFRLGELEENVLSRKKTLLSLSRLSCLADEEISVQETERIVEKSGWHLQLIKFQEDIPTRLLQSELGLQSDITYQPLLSVPQLVKLLLLSAQSDDSINTKKIARALELIYFSSLNRDIVKLSISELELLLSTIWCQAVLLDNWDQFSVDNISGTVMHKVFNSAIELGVPINKLIPNTETLFSNELLREISQQSDVVYLIKRSFESLTAELSSKPKDDRNVNMEIVI